MRFTESIYYKMLSPELATLSGPQEWPAHTRSVLAFIDAIPSRLAGHAYAPGKWTLTQVLAHIAEAQIVMMGRVLFISRGDAKPLPGFDENLWVANGGQEKWTLPQARDYYARVSALGDAIFAGLQPGALSRQGVANGLVITVEEILLYMMAHEDHHVDVIRARYLGS